MFKALTHLFRSKNELERLAEGTDRRALFLYLKTNPVLVVRRPRKYLDPKELSPEKLMEELEIDAKELAECNFEPWILGTDEGKRLLIFSSEKKLETFAFAISKELNKVFGLGSAKILLPDMVAATGVNVFELNAFSEQSWELTWSEPK